MKRAENNISGLQNFNAINDNPIDNSHEYNFYFGIPHAHTSYSDGKGIPFDAYEHARSKGLQFMIIADHSNFLDGVKNNNFEYDKLTNQYIEKLNSQWFNTKLEAELINTKYDDFIAIRGFEMSSKGWGHINVINSENYVEGKKQIRSLQGFFDWLKMQNNIVVSINHPGRSFKNIRFMPELDGIVNLIEVGDGAYPRKYKRSEECYYRALDMGWHLGAINGQDNHIDNWGEGDNLTVILAEELSKEKLLNALRNRRTYSTETRTLKLIFKIKGLWMGSNLRISCYENLRFQIFAEDYKVGIEKLQVITNHGKIYNEKLCGNTNIVNWEFETGAARGAYWFVIKVIHADGRWGISSPIFVDIN